YGEIGQRAYTLLRSTAFESFIQDTWRVSPRLTIEMGLRHSYYQPWYAVWNDIANFDSRFYDPAKRATVDPTGGFITSGDPYNGVVRRGDASPDSAHARPPAESVANVNRLFHGLPRGFVNDYWNNFAPRLGIAWRATNKTVVRAGAGIYHHRTLFNSG